MDRRWEKRGAARLLPLVPLTILFCLAFFAWWMLSVPPERLVQVRGRPEGEPLVELKGLIRAAERGRYVVRHWKGEWRPYWPPRRQVLQTLQWVADRASEARSARGFMAALLQHGRLMAWRCGTAEAGEVLVTGYFVPRFPASHKRTTRFRYPIYGVPDDLITVDLRRIDPALPPRRLVLKREGHRATAYPARAEIDAPGVKIPAPVLGWVASEVEGFILQVQGSGRLLFPDGAVTVHFAASNGRPYRSIGKILVRRGFMRREEVTLPSLVEWLRGHPEEGRAIMAENPRYVFFRMAGDEIEGAYGAALEAKATAALDPAFYPPGALMLLSVRWPGRRGPVLVPVVNLDRGAAIQGPNRIDLFCGEGQEAMDLAGILRNRGRLFMVVIDQGNM